VQADSLVRSKDSRPFEPTLLRRVDWHRCTSCRETFGTAEGLRSHRRFGRCSGRGDPLDEPGIDEIELRRAVRERLHWLAGTADPR
jgi:hypothetical protein